MCIRDRKDVDPDEVVEVGDTVEALVVTKEDKEGRLILSKKRAQYAVSYTHLDVYKRQAQRRGHDHGPERRARDDVGRSRRGDDQREDQQGADRGHCLLYTSRCV